MAKVEYRFRGQKPNEEVIAFYHRHPVVLLSNGYIILLAALIPWVIFVFTAITATFVWVFLIGTTFAAWKTFEAYFTWTNTIYVLTNSRVILTEQKSFFTREVNEVPYAKIQEVSHEVKGFYYTMLNVGNVSIVIASGETLVLKVVSQPYEVEQKISHQIDK